MIFRGSEPTVLLTVHGLISDRLAPVLNELAGGFE